MPQRDMKRRYYVLARKTIKSLTICFLFDPIPCNPVFVLVSSFMFRPCERLLAFRFLNIMLVLVMEMRKFRVLRHRSRGNNSSGILPC